MTRRPARDGEPKPPWCSGAARLEPGLSVNGHSLVMAARCRLEHVIGETWALLDTGAQWSLIGGEVADALRDQVDDEAHDVTLQTRLGTVRGRLHRVPITLVADEGIDLSVQSSILLAPEWKGPLILGYGGFLERFRMALDPGSGPGDSPWLLFGSDQ